MSFEAPEESQPTNPPENLVESAAVAPPANARPPFTSFRGLAVFVLFCAVGLIFAPLLVSVGYAVLKPFFHWTLSTRALVGNTFFQLVAQAVFYVFLMVYVYAAVVGYHHLPFWRGIGWKAPARRHLSVLILTGVGLTILVGLLAQLMPDKGEFPLEKLFSSPTAAYTLAVFAIFVAPFMEELIFRGILFAFFQAKAGVALAVLSTAVLFAAFHIEEYWGAWHHVLLILVVGLVLSTARAVTGWLAPSVIVHMTYNGCLMLALYFQTDHFQNIQKALRH